MTMSMMNGGVRKGNVPAWPVESTAYGREGLAAGDQWCDEMGCLYLPKPITISTSSACSIGPKVKVGFLGSGALEDMMSVVFAYC